jgi:hypothetical protein
MMLITMDDLLEEDALKKADEEARALLAEEASGKEEVPAEKTEDNEE